MASRTGAERLIAPPPAKKTTSAGLCLALVLAGLLAGCGGGSSDPKASTAGGSSNTTASTGQDPSGSSNSAATGHSPGAGDGPSAGGGQSGASPQKTSETPSARGQKHGARIVLPKGPREQAPSAAEAAELTVADMSLTSPSLPPGSGEAPPLLATYTCDGKDSWPAFSWSGVPAGTAELIFYAMNVAPVEGKLFVDWAVGGLDPALTGIEAGKLPKGAVVGTNSFGKRGYEICPEGSETYIFAVYALPRALSPEPGFDARELRRQILGVSGNVGLYSATYTRG